MANNKMLIDASHPEETRVAVVRGNRIEEFDFESQAKKQLRGNIYLAKVTRVEPSLQAAFVDYGGNRHGFLAFSEIHPDYYQIPTADRQALLEEEAAEQAEIVAEEEEESSGERPKRSRGGRKGSKRGSRARSTKSESDEAVPEESDDAADNGELADELEEQAEDATDDDEDNNDDFDGDNEDEDDNKTIAAIIETDSISEPAPEDDGETGDSDSDSEGEAPAKEAKAKAKPKRRTTRRKTAKKSQQESAEEGADAPVETETEPEATAEESAASSANEPVSDDNAGEDTKKKRGRGRGRRKVASEKSASDESTGEEKSADEEDQVESVGQEDALEEVPFRRKPRRQYKIQEVIKRRQVMLVQVVKEERGNKGAALTTYLSLAGRYSVLMPNTARGGGISRKITNSADRKRLKTIASELDVPSGMGVILRTAGASRTKAEIKRDFEYLMRLWENVRNLTLTSNAPCLVYEEGSLIKRSIRDLYDKDTGEVLVSGEEGYREAKEFMRMLMPSHAKNVKPYADDQPIFSRFSVEQQLDRLLTAQVTLKSGGYLVINQTEALVSIDVNSGRATREHSIEDTAFQTNLEAADEIARQLRLRDLAGLIVIDFIDMEEKRNNRAVEKRLKDALKNDRARIQVGRISHFGLLEMSRQRIRASVIESTMDVCPHCGGAGHVRSSTAIALHVFRGIEDHAMRHSRNDIVVRCPTSVAIDILNSKRAGLSEIEHRFGLHIIIEADASLPGQNFVIEKGSPATGTPAKPAQISPDYLMDEDEDEVVEEEEEETSETRGNDEDGGGRKRRRRRRGKRHAEDGDEGSSADKRARDDRGNREGDDDESDGEDGDSGRKRRRRRGKRGGRKNRSDADQLETGAGADEAPDSEVAEPQPETAQADEESDVTASEPQNEPENRNSPEKKAEAAPDPAPPVEEEPSASPRGRNTRRPRKTAQNGGQDDDASQMQGDTAVAEHDAPGDENGDDPGKPRRSGWWNRGGGFF